MKLNNINFEKLNTDKDMKVSRRPIVGFIKKALIIGLALAAVHAYNEYQDSKDLGIFTPESEITSSYQAPINVGVEQVNDLNVIINGSNCSDSFISGIADELLDDGINVTWTEDLENVNTDGAVVITLDQQYISGPGMVVVAPYENGRNDNSDALALAMQTGFNEQGFFADEIQCGKTGFEELPDGTVVEMVMSDTEKSVTPNTSFVELCFGTQNASPKLVGKAIKLSLARFAYYVSNEKVSGDLLYRTEHGESIEDAASKVGVTDFSILDDEVLPENTVLKNDKVLTIDSFDKGTPVDLGGLESTIWYQK